MTFRVICSWCRALLAAGTPGAPTSDGICAGCAKRLLDDFKKGRPA